ncbi:SRPBCC family protein [Nocardia sp. NPDC020380]|uniref:SRPBCC family protein n=1 Tax=Nocardia sp. NPDC020380 TaxID=3364309 RepID=UPI00379F1177
MATVRVEFDIEADAESVWKVISDWASAPVRMAPGFVTESVEAENGDRVVTFASGAVARERFIALDEDRRRVVFSVVGEALKPTHDNASMQILPREAGGCTFVWIHDVLPDAFGEPMLATMQAATPVIQQALRTR